MPLLHRLQRTVLPGQRQPFSTEKRCHETLVGELVRGELGGGEKVVVDGLAESFGGVVQEDAAVEEGVGVWRIRGGGHWCSFFKRRWMLQRRVSAILPYPIL